MLFSLEDLHQLKNNIFKIQLLRDDYFHLLQNIFVEYNIKYFILQNE